MMARTRQATWQAAERARNATKRAWLERARRLVGLADTIDRGVNGNTFSPTFSAGQWSEIVADLRAAAGAIKEEWEVQV